MSFLILGSALERFPTHTRGGCDQEPPRPACQTLTPGIGGADTTAPHLTGKKTLVLPLAARSSALCIPLSTPQPPQGPGHRSPEAPASGHNEHKCHLSPRSLRPARLRPPHTEDTRAVRQGRRCGTGAQASTPGARASQEHWPLAPGRLGVSNLTSWVPAGGAPRPGRPSVQSVRSARERVEQQHRVRGCLTPGCGYYKRVAADTRVQVGASCLLWEDT